MTPLDLITSEDDGVRHFPFDVWCGSRGAGELELAAAELEAFRQRSGNLYERVRALIFLSSIHRYELQPKAGGRATIPYEAIEAIRSRRFERAIACLLRAQSADRSSPALSSALAVAYRGLAFQTLADQVRRSVRGSVGNQWMFRAGHALDYPLRLDPRLTSGPPFAALHETTPVRMDLTHSAWSDIFFLAMDYPEGARVLNISVDLAIRGSGQAPRPPVEAFFRVIDEPVLRLVSVDLQAQTDIGALEEVFDFARDYLGLLKAAVIASGLIPAGLEGSGQSLTAILRLLTGRDGAGIELVSQVNDIPKGSRLAVSTNLLACLITVCMRATRQIRALTGPLAESDRRQVAARAILGEWLGGSGGGWQDSGGVWPGVKLIEAVRAAAGDPELGVSRGCLLPRHTLLDGSIPASALRELEASLVVVHGGMSQDVGPILEMCTERYLLRSSREWEARQLARQTLDGMLAALRAGDIRTLAALTQRNYDGPIQTIIPWAANAYTQKLIERARAGFGDQFWGFWMLGGMSGGGMGFVFDPGVRERAAEEMAALLAGAKREMETSFPFGVEPVVYDFAINSNGTSAELGSGKLSRAYYLFAAPALLRRPARELTAARRLELGQLAHDRGVTESLIERMLPQDAPAEPQGGGLRGLLLELGFDPQAHERLRSDYRAGRIGLAQNVLPPTAAIEDADASDLAAVVEGDAEIGREAVAAGRLAIVTMAGGLGTRWTKGAGVVKALHPFHRIPSSGRYVSFLDIHFAKARAARREFGAAIPHVVTTSYLTRDPIAEAVRAAGADAHVSPGRNIGLRMIPTLADLRYLWEVLPQQQLDEQKQKMRDGGRASLQAWVREAGEGADYDANQPSQCIHPVGHWYEIPNLLQNGVLHGLLSRNPELRHLLLHNVDTLGASADPGLLGRHIASGAAMTVEVTPRLFDDHGGGLARVNGRARLVEGLALPGEETEAMLTFYNTGTYWIAIDPLLRVFGLTRADLADDERTAAAVRHVAQRMPSYITIKDVKKRWGRGQEDVFPVAQFERLWGDMTALGEMRCQYVAVPRRRGQQLKDVSQLDPWLRDGSAAEFERLWD